MESRSFTEARGARLGGVLRPADRRKLERRARQRAERAQLDRDTRADVREAHAHGATPSEIAAALGVSRQTIHTWLRDAD